MRIAYFSPLNPRKSGISDYSEELLPYLARHMEIDIYVDGFTPSNKQLTDAFKVFNLRQYASMAKSRSYDANLYHMGNSEVNEKVYYHLQQYPGIVVLHDYSLHGLVAAITFGRKKNKEYLGEMAYCHGEEGRAAAQAFLDGVTPPPWKDNSLLYPMNKRVIEAATGLIVHSYFARNRIKSARRDTPIKKINFHSLEVKQDPIASYQEARKALGLADRDRIIASFGFVTPTKRIDKILTAVARLHKEGYPIKYYVVGGDLEPQLAQQIHDLGIPDGVVVCTGFLGLDEGFIRYMRATDIACNLRYPVNGETSSTLHRLLGMGKPVLVSNAGSFREYPSSVAIKIDVANREEEDLYSNLKALLDDESRRKALGHNAYSFAKENLSIERSARDYFEFIAGLVNKQYKYETLIEQLADELTGLGVENDTILVQQLAKALAEFCG